MDRKWTANGPHRKKDLPAFRGFWSRRSSILTGPKGPKGSRTPFGPSWLSRSACLVGTGCSCVAPPPESPHPGLHCLPHRFAWGSRQGLRPRTPDAAPAGACGFAAEGKTPPRRGKWSKKAAKPCNAPYAPFAMLRAVPPLSSPLWGLSDGGLAGGRGALPHTGVRSGDLRFTQEGAKEAGSGTPKGV